MKKLLTILLALLMLITLVGCSSKEEAPIVEEPKQQEEVVEPIEEEPIVGGYIEVEDTTITEELEDIFYKAFSGFLGATYKPVKLVATQVVAGTNYKFLAEGVKTTNPITRGTYYVYVNKDLQGNISLLDIEVIEEKQDEASNQDVTQMSFWVVFYDAYGNELQRTVEKYGTIPSFKYTLPEGFNNWAYKNTGKDVTTFKPITTNTYFKAICHTITYTVTFDTQGKGSLANTEVVKNSLVTRPQDPDVDGYIISGWYTEPECTNEWDFLADRVTKDITLYANWIETGLFANGICYQPLTLANCGTDASSVISLITQFDTTMVLPNGVTSIGDSAFYGCNSLLSVVIPYGVTSIGSSAFHSCYNLKSVEIPNSVTSIGIAAFCDANIQSITTPSGVTTISEQMFSGCASLQSITIKGNVQSIGVNAFSGCISLPSIDIPSTVTSIGSAAFSGCNNLLSITIPSGVTLIDDWTFSSCTSLSSVSIPSTVTTIGEYAFTGCANLTSLTIPEGVVTIKTHAFDSAGLISVSIPSTVASIGNGAFVLSCLESVTIPSNVTSFGESVFDKCFSLASVIISDGVTSIPKNTFYNCSSLTSVTIPNSVTSIGFDAFNGCSSLPSVTIPSSVTSIYDYAFCGCSSLSLITFTGTKEQWNSITKGTDWNDSINTTTVTCSDGSVDL